MEEFSTERDEAARALHGSRCLRRHGSYNIPPYSEVAHDFPFIPVRTVRSIHYTELKEDRRKLSLGSCNYP